MNNGKTADLSLYSNKQKVEHCVDCGFWIGRCTLGRKNMFAISEACENASPRHGGLGL
jgi:hypothetical protein